MLFPTIEFALFFAVVFLVSWLAVKWPGVRKYFLIAASYFFYAWWDWRFAFLLFFVSASSYSFGFLIGNAVNKKEKKRLLAASVTVSLAVLGFFKYYGFFTTSFNNALLGLNIDMHFPLVEVLLPVGISFFTFQAISYTVDVYRGDIPVCRDISSVLLYISFFPQLVAGPIVRASDFLPQLDAKPDIKNIFASEALILIVSGLFKKIVIANYLATLLVDPVFGNPAGFSWLDNIFAVYGYAVQIYCDFSAYSDIAIGVALLLGFRFRENFNQPYRAFSLRDFWRRWHISLSTWLRDYLYIPLGGSKKGKAKTYRNLAITMLLGGLWHGAAWNFIFWGGLHGGGLAIERFVYNRFKIDIKSRWVKGLMTILVFHFVCLAWIYFRSTSFTEAGIMLETIFSFGGAVTMITPFVAGLIFTGLLINFIPPRLGERIAAELASLHPVAQGALLGLVLLIIGSVTPDGIAPFIYFRF